MFLSYLTAWFNILSRCYHAEALVSIDGRQNHALTLDAHHLTGGKVGHEKDALADEFLWILVEGGNTRTSIVTVWM